MSYREKTCPTCGKTHKKRGPYCSRSCGNSRTFTPAQREHLSQKKTEWLTSDNDKAEIDRWRINSKDDNNLIGPQLESPLSTKQFVQDGDLWSEVE